MYPVLVNWGNFYLPSWHVFFVLGAFAGYGLLAYLLRIYEPDISSRLNSFFLLSYIGGYFGARWFSLLVEAEPVQWSDFFAHGSMTFYGGFIGALFLVSLYIKWQQLSWLAIWDLMIPSGFLGLAIGRIGCFLNGDDYGIPVLQRPTPWWAVTFTNHPDQIPRIPVQLVESLAVALLVVLLCFALRYYRLRWGKGYVGSLGLAAYCVLRFLDEYWRDDERGWWVEGHISTSQGLSLLCLLLLLMVHCFAKFQRRRKSNDTSSINGD
jgi:phosphatidylglycerol:prolipoprotein diacylglycerol transferase